MASKGFRSAVARRGAALGLAVLIVTAVVGSLVLRAPGRATASSTSGYWLAGADGGVFNYGQAPFHGSAGSVPLSSPIVGFVPTPTAAGYWMVAGDGGIFAFGDAAFFGSMGGKPLSRPISSMAAVPSGKGYWLVASDGGVFAFGDAPFFGSLSGENLSKPIVDFAVTPTGRGYWMTTSDGQVYGFGDAAYYGSVSEAVDLNKRIQAMAPTPTGSGYWLVAADGGIFAFGDAGYFGTADRQGREARRRHRGQRHRPRLLPGDGQRADLPLRRRHQLWRRLQFRPQQQGRGHGHHLAVQRHGPRDRTGGRRRHGRRRRGRPAPDRCRGQRQGAVGWRGR